MSAHVAANLGKVAPLAGHVFGEVYEHLPTNTIRGPSSQTENSCYKIVTILVLNFIVCNINIRIALRGSTL